MAESTYDSASFAERLRWFRVAAGLTQEALAERSRVSVKAISALENGRRSRPRRDTVSMLAAGLGLDPAGREALAAAVRPPGGSRAPAWPLPPEPRAGIPLDPMAHFAGRGAELAQLRRLLRRSRRVAVHGLGGVGKTQLVVRHLHQHRAEYPDGVFWLRADQEASLVGDLASLAWRLGLPERTRKEQEHQIEAVLRWLGCHRRWLLVLDNVEPETKEAVAHWLPPGLGGRLLLTSRTPMWSVRLHLQPLPLKVATRLLLERTGQTDVRAARTVARTLGCLPLALEQVAAFVQVSGRDLAGYAELLRTRLLELMGEGKPDDYPRPVASTWQLSFERIERELPAAAALLRLCAFLAPDDIPVALLRAGSGEVLGELDGALGDTLDLDRAIATLARYSLLERQGDGLRVHRLVQSVVRESIGAAPRDTSLAAAIRLLRAAFPDQPDEPGRWPLCARLLPHVRATERLADGTVEARGLGWLLNRVGVYLWVRGEYALARPVHERAHAVRERVLGPDHPDTAEGLNDLAALLGDQGDLAAAQVLLERAVAVRDRVLGPNHLDTAVSLNNLAMVLRAQGELATARPLLERAVAIHELGLGRDDPNTARVVDNLGWLLHEQGETTAARSFLERALATRERILGPDHLDVAVSLHNLGRLGREGGDLAAAEPCLRRSAATFERLLGAGHSRTARSFHHLALLFRDRGDLAAARRLLESALVSQERALGPEHGWTMESRSTLAEITSELERRSPVTVRSRTSPLDADHAEEPVIL
jgi:transcriptional regulator with XRE-family HTH domain/tetratricopeptide (TPR) repeat protein